MVVDKENENIAEESKKVQIMITILDYDAMIKNQLSSTQ